MVVEIVFFGSTQDFVITRLTSADCFLALATPEWPLHLEAGFQALLCPMLSWRRALFFSAQVVPRTPRLGLRLEATTAAD